MDIWTDLQIGKTILYKQLARWAGTTHSMNRAICAFHFGSMQKKLYYKLSEDHKLLRLENGYIETFLWKRNGQK